MMRVYTYTDSFHFVELDKITTVPKIPTPPINTSSSSSTTYLNPSKSLMFSSHTNFISVMADHTTPFTRVPDIETSYTSLQDHHESSSSDTTTINLWKPIKGLLYTFSIIMFISMVMVVLVTDHRSNQNPSSSSSVILQSDSNTKTPSSETLRPAAAAAAMSRGVSEGVSEKTFRLLTTTNDEEGASSSSFQWTNDMLSWQRNGYHFRPEKNWMSDPNGPVFYKGWYHFFYQYNPEGAVWGNIVWGHSVSKDLIHWLHLPFAMVPDQWFDINGVFSGSATILADGSLVMLYTGSTNESVQVQNVAYPADPSDPLMVKWVKYSENPVLVPPPGIGIKDFRDPTTAWVAPNGKWRITIGSKINRTGISLVYETADFLTYKLLDGLLHAVQGTGMWECVDFYPVSMTGENGLDTSVNGPDVKHVLKVSLDDDRHDYYALGDYDQYKDVWTPNNPEIDVGIGMRYDYGTFYASKTFYDQNKQRRVLWGWIGESDSKLTDVTKGWASLQSVPRVITFDKNTKTNIIQWPVQEVEKLRLNSKTFDKIELEAGSVVPLDVGSATQLDITAEFEVSKKALEGVMEADVGYNCSTSDGAAGRNALGPFGLLVLANEGRTEQTPVYFYIAKGTDGNAKTFFCTDKSRSSKATDVDRQVRGSTFPVLDGEKLSVRILVDHSIIEAFAQGGRTVVTSRVYPTEAIRGNARVFLFNNATGTSITATSLKIWQMNSAFIREFPTKSQV